MEESVQQAPDPDLEMDNSSARAVPDVLEGEGENENEQPVNDMDTPIMKIPNEVWVLILSQLSQKELVQARTVWKKWREVVDAHFEFSVIVHDGKTNLERVYDLRIRDCLITRLICDKDIFQYPNLLRRVRFWGPINVSCFQRIMDSATSVEELSLTKFALMQENLVGERRLNGFSKIKKLELLGCMCKDESKTVAKNSSQIFSYNMPDLEKLTLNFHCNIASIHAIALNLMEFLSRHRKIQNVQVSLVPESTHPNEPAAGRTTSVVIPKWVEDSLRNLKLHMLRITTATKDLPLWGALLHTQTRLQDFRMHLSEGGLLTAQTNYVVGIPFELVREPLLNNAPTLVSVELKEVRLSTLGDQGASPIPLDAGVLRYAPNLKRLILYRNTDDYRRYGQSPDQPNIVNLRMLPATIEVLEICRFSCRAEELQYVCDVLENLKNIVLLNTGSLNQLGIHGGIVESISAKPEIQSMNLSPLNYHCSTENKKYEAVKTKFGMNEGDHIYYDFERFRKGLPQPRPPTGESHSSQSSSSSRSHSYRSFERERPHRCCFEWPMFRMGGPRGFRCDPRAHRRRKSRNLPPLQLCLRSSARQQNDEQPGPSAGPSSSSSSQRRSTCCDHLAPEDRVPGQCPGDALSRLLISLDLHGVPSSDRLFGDIKFNHHHERSRRWSSGSKF